MGADGVISQAAGTEQDFDAAGSESIAVDAEIVSVMCDIFKAVGLHNALDIQRFQVKVNNRKVLELILSAANINDTETQKWVLRVIDKLQKIGEKNVRLE